MDKEAFVFVPVKIEIHLLSVREEQVELEVRVVRERSGQEQQDTVLILDEGSMLTLQNCFTTGEVVKWINR